MGEQLNELALFAGAGGGILGGKLLRWRTICAVEWEPYPASVLLARQNDKVIPAFPIWDDVQTFDGRPWQGIVDVVSGGFPCQDISSAGKGAGIDGQRSSMWKHMARIINEVQPTYAFIENSPMLRTRGLGVVLQDLAKMGYNARWGVLSAATVGANHKRERMWIVACNTHGNIKPRRPFNEEVEKLFELSKRNATNANLSQRKRGQLSSRTDPEYPGFSNSCWWQDSSRIHRVDDGVAARMDRLKAIGNGQVPLCAATAWNILNK